MKYSFYCLPLKKSVKGKVTGIVKKKSYGIKGEYKYKGKTYNCHKVCSKAEAERVSKESGIDITYPGMEEAKASENVADVVDAPVAEEQADGVEEVAMIGDETFQPDGNGRVIGSNSASIATATPGTDAVVNINATPFRSEDKDEDGIGPMSMAAETEKKNCGCGQDPCITYGADTVEIEVQDEKEIPENFETFTVSKDLYRRLTAHDDWSDMVSEGQVRVYREDDGVHVSAGGPFADDLLDMIIEAQGFPTVGENAYLDDRFMRDFNTEGGKLKRNAFISAGIGTLGLIAAVMLLNKFAKSQDEDSTED